jgi:hypothetical protein
LLSGAEYLVLVLSVGVGVGVGVFSVGVLGI